jgi:hypothetical protein
MKIANHSVLILLGFLPSCVTIPRTDTNIVLKPSDAVRDISTLEGRRVRLSGYLVLGQEVRVLWDSPQYRDEAAARQASGADPVWNHCLTAYYDFAIARSVESASRSMVDVIGTIGINRQEDDAVDLWSCNDVYITIHQIRRPGRAQGQGSNARVAARSAAASPARATRRSRDSSPSERRSECGQGPSNGCEGD